LTEFSEDSSTPWGCGPGAASTATSNLPPLSSTHSGVYTLILWGIPEGTSVV
jgi:hypothetical protein